MNEDPPFSRGSFIGGLVVSLVIGGFLEIFWGALAGFARLTPLVFIVGAIPGVAIALLSRGAVRDGYAQGLLAGGCTLAILGGSCSTLMLHVRW